MRKTFLFLFVVVHSGCRTKKKNTGWRLIFCRSCQPILGEPPSHIQQVSETYANHLWKAYETHATNTCATYVKSAESHLFNMFSHVLHLVGARVPPLPLAARRLPKYEECVKIV